MSGTVHLKFSNKLEVPWCLINSPYTSIDHVESIFMYKTCVKVSFVSEYPQIAQIYQIPTNTTNTQPIILPAEPITAKVPKVGSMEPHASYEEFRRPYDGTLWPFSGREKFGTFLRQEVVSVLNEDRNYPFRNNSEFCITSRVFAFRLLAMGFRPHAQNLIAGLPEIFLRTTRHVPTTLSPI